MLIYFILTFFFVYRTNIYIYVTHTYRPIHIIQNIINQFVYKHIFSYVLQTEKCVYSSLYTYIVL